MLDIIEQIRGELEEIATGRLQDLTPLAKHYLDQNQTEETQSLNGEYDAAIRKRGELICCGQYPTYRGRFRNYSWKTSEQCSEGLGTPAPDSACEIRRPSRGGSGGGGSLLDICTKVPCTIKNSDGKSFGKICDPEKDFHGIDIVEIVFITDQEYSPI